MELEKAMIGVMIFELLDLLVSLYKTFLNGAQINYFTERQLLRVVELRNILERLRIEWDTILTYHEDCQLINTTFRDAKLYFGFLKEEKGEDYCFE